MKLNPYLAFDGRCREAFDFYRRALGGKISFMQTIGESPMASSMPPEAHGRVMYVTMEIDDQVLQGADAPPGISTKQRILFLSHTDRGEDHVRIIHARPATKTEAHGYQESRK